MEEAHQNALQGEFDLANRNGREMDLVLVETKEYKEAHRHLGEMMLRDGPHGALIQYFRNQIRPSLVVTLESGERVDTQQISTSRSHHCIHTNRLTTGHSYADPLVVNRSPPVNFYPNGRSPCQQYVPEVLI